MPARSVVACALDDLTGELTRGRSCPQPEAILAWLRQLEGPIAVVYEAASLVAGGLRESVRFASAGQAALRVRAGVLMVLASWAVFAPGVGR